MKTERLRELISQNIVLDVNDDFTQEQIWKEMTDILTENTTSTIDFFTNMCTDEEFFWLGSIFEDIAEINQSVEFINAIKARLSKVHLETYNQNSFTSNYMKKNVDYNEYVRSISMNIEYAEARIDN